MKKPPIPPIFLNWFLVLAIGLHFLIPVRQIIDSPYNFFGFIIIFIGIALNIWSVRMLEKNNTTLDFDKTTTRLVITGPFLFSRNPLYLSGVILSFGVAILFGSLITFVFPIALLVILDRYYIPFEERKLEKAFGEDYSQYKQSVRRWI
ncbi:MAG: methyltransferase family protein [Candidatus Hodarchaeales archaeon]|jgi:protein-S-isoprenylcysteine O-methyltransferase Ste14